MPFAWTERQFVGGALCLDFANTVYYANDADRRGDRLRDGADIASWLEAACRFGSAGDYAPMLPASGEAFDTPAVADMLMLRQAIDDLFRSVVIGSTPSALAYRRVLFELGSTLSQTTMTAGPDGLVPSLSGYIAPTPETARAALAHSGIALAASPLLARMKTCPNCSWLFVDRSRNASRLWCDMLTCGNRAKARRYHETHRQPDS
jgi:predicted RNA-binding Zn ribbon-like protein